ncbi:MAG: IPT/TIG domain-containing protein [Imperialibacter sp.]|uniref:IPT/TIG domain-containing protein n=1 Tax=Imperialibacter sp. TaxID=2038411 RepID=UPI003A88B0FD
MINKRVLVWHCVSILFLASIFFIVSCGQEDPEPVPVISSFSPDNGIAGDTVTILGENFSNLAEENIVKLNETTATVISATPTGLVVRVPATASTGKISVTVNGQTGISDIAFTVFQSPEIASFSPSFGPSGSEVTITGKNFSSAPEENLVTLGGIPVTIVSSTETTLNIIVPEEAITGKFELTVHELSTNSVEEFIVPPIVESFTPKNGTIGSTIEITGSGFSPEPSKNIVMFNGVAATVSSSTAKSILVVVPELAATGKITVTVSSHTVISPEDFAVLPMISTFSPSVGAVGATVTITGSGFSISPTGNSVNINGVPAIVSQVSATTITFKIPETATSGQITVTTESNSTTSTATFEVVIEAAAGGGDYDMGNSIGVDSFGNTYIVGSFRGSAGFAGTLLSSFGSDDIFVAKYNSNCDLTWVKQIGGADSDIPATIVVDLLGNLYVAGRIFNQASFGGIVKGESGSNLFVTKLNTSGDVAWVKTFVSNSSQVPSFSSMVSDLAGNLYLAGFFAESISVGSSSLISNGGTDLLIMKLNSASGDLLWAKNMGGDSDDFGSAIEINANDELFLAGAFFETTHLGDKSLTSLGSLDAFVAKLDAEGNPIWVKQLGGGNYDNIYSLAADSQGNLYGVGYFTGSATIASAPIVAQGNEDILIAKFATSSGDLVWVKTEGGYNYDNARSVDLDNNGNIYVTGYFSTSAFDDFGLTTEMNSRDAFVAKYNPSGEILWAQKAGGPEDDYGQALAVGANGIVHITGSFTETVTFGSTALTSFGGSDIFLWKIWQGE